MRDVLLQVNRRIVAALRTDRITILLAMLAVASIPTRAQTTTAVRACSDCRAIADRALRLYCYDHGGPFPTAGEDAGQSLDPDGIVRSNETFVRNLDEYRRTYVGRRFVGVVSLASYRTVPERWHSYSAMFGTPTSGYVQCFFDDPDTKTLLDARKLGAMLLVSGTIAYRTPYTGNVLRDCRIGVPSP